MVSSEHNNPPACVLELDEETTKFIIENCEANIRLAMQWLQSMVVDETHDRAGSEKIVALIEKFKKLKDQVEASRVN